MKKALLFTFILVFATINGQASASQYKQQSKSQQNAAMIKFGPQLGNNVSSRRNGVYFEYKFQEALGIQSGLLYFKDMYLLTETDDIQSIIKGKNNKTDLWHVVTPQYITLPIILRSYPGAARQFCLFAGMEAGYLIGGQRLTGDANTNFEKLRKKIIQGESIKKTELKDIKDGVRKMTLSMVVGFDYEFNFGLLLGFRYTKGLVDVIKTKSSALNWTLQPTLAYNFGKFL